MSEGMMFFLSIIAFGLCAVIAAFVGSELAVKACGGMVVFMALAWAIWSTPS